MDDAEREYAASRNRFDQITRGGDTCGDAGGILASAHVGLREALPTTPGA